MTRSATPALDQQVQLVGLPKPVAEFRFHPTRRWRFDYAWPDKSIAVEVDGAVWTGGRHTRGAGVEKDCEKYAEALLAGWRVLRVTTGQVKSGQALTWVERLLR
jgi:very-short-patch-repair endonuclease